MTGEVAGTGRALDDLLARAEIMELGAKYCSGVDRQDVALFLSIWHPDGEYLIGRRAGRFRGTAELATAVDFVRSAYASTHHWTTNHIIERHDADHASARSDSFALCVDVHGAPSLVSASYDDRCERIDGSWKLRRRVVRRWLISDPLDVRTVVPAPIDAS